MRFYTLTIDDGRVGEPSRSGGLDVSDTDLLDGNGTAEPISSPSDELDVDVVHANPRGDRRAVELDELLKSVTVAPIPVAYDAEPSLAGYYAAESTNRRIDRATDGEDRQRHSIGLKKIGTRSSHLRTVSLRVTQPDPGNIFGNDTTALIGVPAAATRVKWYDRSFTSSEPANVAVPGAGYGSAYGTDYGSTSTPDNAVDLYDARDVSDTLSDDAVLVYRSPDPEGELDVTVWDTYGSDDEVEWARVYNVDHVPRVDDELVIDNGRIRLFVADGPAAIAADEWDSVDEEWTAISLADTGWELVETDLTRIGAVAVEAQCVFGDGSAEYALDLRLERGRQYPQWLIPQSVSDPVPSGLEELLEPIADESIYQTGATLGLVSRRKLRE